MRTRSTLILMAIAAAMVLALIVPVAAQSETNEPEAAQPEAVQPSMAPEAAEATEARLDVSALRSAWSRRARTMTVHHGPLDVALADPSSDGHRLGDVRAGSIETTAPDGRAVGRLDATFTTTSIDIPAAGDETRIDLLVFDFGRAGQVTVLGSVHYPANGSAVTQGERVMRPIVGGSGRFVGVGGSALSERLEDGSWAHRLRFHAAWTDRVVERTVKQRLTEGIREWRAGRKEAREERKDERKAGREAARSARKEAREELKAERRAARETAAEEDEDEAAASE